MNQTLTITSYVDAAFADVIRELNNRGPGLIESAARMSEQRVGAAGAFSGTIEAARVGDSNVVVRIHDEAAHLNGATVSVAPVGDQAAGVTELVIRMGERFEHGNRGSRQFLAATTFVQEATLALGKARRAA